MCDVAGDFERLVEAARLQACGVKGQRQYEVVIGRAQPRGELLSRVTNDIDNIQQTMQQTMSQLLTSLLTVVAVLAIYVRFLCPESPYWVRTMDRKRRIRAELDAGGRLSADDEAWFHKADKVGHNKSNQPAGRFQRIKSK